MVSNALIEKLASEGIVYNEFNEDLGEATLAWEEKANADYAAELFFEDCGNRFAITAIRSTRMICTDQTIDEIVEDIKVVMTDLYEYAM